MRGVVFLLTLMAWIAAVWLTVYFVAEYAINRPRKRNDRLR